MSFSGAMHSFRGNLASLHILFRLACSMPTAIKEVLLTCQLAQCENSAITALVPLQSFGVFVGPAVVSMPSIA